MLCENSSLRKICVGTSESSNTFLKILCEEGLNKNVGLRTLDVTNRALTEESGRLLGDVFVENKACTLEEILLSRNKLKSIGAETLFRILIRSSAPSKLKALDLSSNEIEDEKLQFGIALGHYLALKSCILEKLILSHNPSISLVFAKKGLEMNHSLRVLEMKECGVKDSDFVTIFQALSSQNTLVELDLSDNFITSSGTNKLALYLKDIKTACTSLQTLCLSGNSIEDATALATSLDKFSSLQVLDMSRCGVSIKSVTPLLNTKFLVDLNLSQNEFGNAVCKTVLEWFCNSASSSTSLCRLHLCNNRMNTDGVIPLLQEVGKS